MQLFFGVQMYELAIQLCIVPVLKELQLYLPFKSIHLHTEQQNLRLQKIITAIGIALFFIKMAAWYMTGSVAILTDALESTVNVIAGLIGVYSL